MNFKHNAIRKAMLQRLSAEDRDIPKYVQDKAEFFEKEKGYDTGYAFSTAWSIYCKYKNPGDKVHCKKDPSEYFTGKKASFKSAGAVKDMIMDIVFDGIKYLENFSHIDDDDGEIFEYTQEYIMENFSSHSEAVLEKLLHSKGVSSTIINKYIKKIQNDAKKILF
jgi:hypothetical protein